MRISDNLEGAADDSGGVEDELVASAVESDGDGLEESKRVRRRVACRLFDRKLKG